MNEDKNMRPAPRTGGGVSQAYPKEEILRSSHFARIGATAGALLAGCSGPSLSPPLFTTTAVVAYTGGAQNIPFTQFHYSGGVTLPAALSVPQGDTITLIANQIPFPPAPTLQSDTAGTPNVAFIYFQLTASATTTLSSLPTFTITFPKDVADKAFYDKPLHMAFYDPTATPLAWNYTYGLGMMSASTATFAPPATSFTLQAGVHYYFAAYQQGSSSPPPSQNGNVVIVVPTSAPVLCAPTSVTIGIGQRTVISCAAAGYDGPFTWTIANPSIAAVQLADGTLSLFYVTGLQAGTTTLSIQYQSSAVGRVVITVPSP